MVVRVDVGEQDEFLVWENFVLVEADTPDQAFAVAEESGKRSESSNLEWDGRQAHMELLGVRTVTATDDPGQRPSNGTELSYNQYFVQSESDLKRLREGETVQLSYDQVYLDEESSPD